MTDIREQELRRRREEQRRLDSRRNAKRAERKKRKKKAVICIMLIILLVGGLIALSLTVLFPIRKIQIIGNQRYGASAIQAAAEIPMESNLLRLNTDRVIAGIRKACPYVENVSVKRKLPFTVVIGIQESDPAFSLCLGDRYLLLNRRLELIEESDAFGGGIEVFGAFASGQTPGQPVTFAEPDKQTALLTVYDMLQKQSVDQIEKIDLFEVNKIRLLYGKHVWNLGDTTNLEYKIRFALQVDPKEKDSGTLDLSGLNGGKSGYFKSEVVDDFVDHITPTDAPQAESPAKKQKKS